MKVWWVEEDGNGKLHLYWQPAHFVEGKVHPMSVRVGNREVCEPIWDGLSSEDEIKYMGLDETLGIVPTPGRALVAAYVER